MAPRSNSRRPPPPPPSPPPPPPPPSSTKDGDDGDDGEFWRFYLRQHSHPLTRTVHYCGTVAAILVAVGLLPSPLGGGVGRVLGTLLVGYGPSWLSHFFVERNRPATWAAPLRSLKSDLKMLGCFLTGRLSEELRAAGVNDGSSRR